MQFNDDSVGSRYMPPTTPSSHNAAQPPVQAAVTTHEPAPPLTLADELRAALVRSAEFETQEQALRTELQKLAEQRDQLATRGAEVAHEIEQRRDAQVDAVLDGTGTAKKSGITELQESAQAIEVAQKLVADRTSAADAELKKLWGLRGEHETNVLGDIRWRIALARYARLIRDLIPLAHELRTLSTIQRRSFMPGTGLVIDPRATDIVGIPLPLALQMAETLGNVEEVLQ